MRAAPVGVGAMSRLPQDHGFSQEDIWHAARHWGCSEEYALRQLIEEEKRYREDD